MDDDGSLLEEIDDEALAPLRLERFCLHFALLFCELVFELPLALAETVTSANYDNDQDRGEEDEHQAQDHDERGAGDGFVWDTVGVGGLAPAELAAAPGGAFAADGAGCEGILLAVGVETVEELATDQLGCPTALAQRRALRVCAALRSHPLFVKIF